MQKTETLLAVQNAGVVAVVRGKSKEEAYKTAVACIKGGVKAIELTFTAPQADEIIRELHDEYSADPAVVVGAGTVLDAVTARIAIMAGAKFIVAPSFDKEVALLCNEYQIPYMPGCMTVTEIQTAMRYGAEIVKVFPGSVLGRGFIKAVKAPLPQVNIMPTGGVNLENMHEWFEAGVVVVGAGSNLTAAAAKGDYDAVTKQAEAYHKEILRIQGK
ncbi:bifunctional 4-hydroxy-2-oxoglutarate aldolase/2-dehydro-3-deoxy-phosphogluconate aldolase [Lactobacillus sp. ESL0679]|uniref:bifunctional 4-hydroxy-2-oxoglutarate aldolase/2-dehydro-3-deoxy-phosphogluconate aldolase n=1 Tax=Lactobacillus sp. ESL0679 TaxID=2983209 RepID=UPI0023F81A86|nr:bifunctional 4-hydroxy-2-oxoglutarate aldolase/2-dehydro-3-deoxy-phosphogluconate aldolase [Lactobacillus sp. ESL0679]MDF7682419.1 bifunctional 4-hydroxy-2-oxoglutarate aldolase/2-dehydro-3-deoxy-phosphogluconate aldolase [Lactobacillus sp. ESL0679]